tara:strand:- start:2346 stop:2729 length:384 start_codon:yes stop_codon:yes gene_type:complete
MIKMMLEVWLAGGLAVMLAVMIYILKRMNTDKVEAIARTTSLRDDLGGMLVNMVNALDFDIPSAHDMKDIIEGCIQDSMGSFSQPTGQDMIMSAISQFVMAKIPKGPLGDIAAGVLPTPIQPQEGPE